MAYFKFENEETTMFVALNAKLDSNFRNVTFVSLSTKQRI